MYTHLLVPTDGSPLSDSAVTQAIALARALGAALTFMHVEPAHEVSFWGSEGIVDPASRAQAIARDERRAAQILEAARAQADAAGASAQTRACRDDQPYQAIIASAHAAGCDLIVMASHGRHGLSAALLGSETQQVLTHSRIPVLVLR